MAYAAARGGKWRVVTDGIDGPEHDRIGQDSVVFSPDSRRLAYIARRGRDSFVQFVVVDGVPGKPYDGIIGSGLAFSPDSKHVVYGTGRGGKGFVVVDGHECWEYDGFLSGLFSGSGGSCVQFRNVDVNISRQIEDRCAINVSN